ncbi:unnamed protein product [Camellia sinensis]
MESSDNKNHATKFANDLEIIKEKAAAEGEVGGGGEIEEVGGEEQEKAGGEGEQEKKLKEKDKEKEQNEKKERTGICTGDTYHSSMLHSGETGIPPKDSSTKMQMHSLPISIIESRQHST